MQFLILGPLEVRSGAHSVRIAGAKQRALLGVLLLRANETVSTPRLVDELWGESPPATAERLVQGYVHALRKELEGGLLKTQAPGYRLELDPGSLDLHEFERLIEAARGAERSESVELRRRALALWRGDPLAGVELKGPSNSDLGRLSELRLTTLIEQIDAELDLGRHAQLVGELETLIAKHPYRERLHAQLMLALYRSGRQTEALQTYRAFQRRLDEELGLQPSRELRDLEARILRQDESLTMAEPATRPLSLSSITAPPSRSAPRRRPWAVAAVAVMVAAVIAGAVAFLRDGAPSIQAAPNSVAVIDPATNRVVEGIPVGIRPGPLAAFAGSLWVGNLDDKSLTRVDLATHERVKDIPLGVTPDGIAGGAGSVWVVNGRLGTLTSVNPRFNVATESIPVTGTATVFPAAGVDVGPDGVWAVFGGDATLARVDPARPRLEPQRGRTGSGAWDIVDAFGDIWVSNWGDGTVERFNPGTFTQGGLHTYPLGRGPKGMAKGFGALWVATEGADAVSRIDASTAFEPAQSIPVGGGPTAVATGARAVWVSNTAEGTVSRIDPSTNDVVETIPVGNAPSGIAVAHGSVWVAIQAP